MITLACVPMVQMQFDTRLGKMRARFAGCINVGIAKCKTIDLTLVSLITHACMYFYRLAPTDGKKALAFIYIKIQFLVCLVRKVSTDSTAFPGISN